MSDLQPSLPRLSPLPYHEAIVRCLRVEEPDVWNWACSAQAREEHANAVRSDLLKETYRLDEDAHPGLHRSFAAAAARLGVRAPVTLYQAGDGAMNATLYYLPGEIHIVFAGPVLERLNSDELEAVLGHELAHYVLWELEGGVYHAAERILTAAANDPRTSASYVQTARLFRLYTEAFADRGGAIACGGPAPAVTALVKTLTGLREVSAASYLKQADEICAPGGVSSEARSHPEVFVRARAVQLWCEADSSADQWLMSMLEGPLSLETLDLIGQQRLTKLTRRVLAQLLRQRCLRSEGLLAHARRFFPDFKPDTTEDESLSACISAESDIHDYIAALLMDFVVADRELDDVALAAAFEMARQLGMPEAFERFALKELRLPKRQFNKTKQEAASLLERAEMQHG
jgi:hypothetical protein